MFRDNYTNFTFDDLRSENFKVWITNKKDLKRNMSPNFSDKFNTPTYGQIRYHEGTTIDKQDFKFSCVAVDVTLNEWRAISEWLSPLKSGKLTFDWNDKYYYMVKLSKAPSGTMFIKNRIDNTMGQLYIVTFDLEFTTVYDWAALGPYCEQQMYSTGTNVDSIDPSIYNNSYYIPQILRINKYNAISKNTVSGNFITTDGSEEIQIQISEQDTPVYCVQADGFKIYKIELKSDESNPSLSNYILSVNTEKSETEPWEVVGILDQDSEGYCSLRLFNKQVYFTSTASCNYKLIRSENVAFCNPSSFDMYPLFYAPSTFKVKQYDKELYSYQANGGTISHEVLINNQQLTLTYGGRSIEAVTNYFGQPLFSNIHVNSQLIIPSGRPELLKTIFVDDVEVEDSAARKATFLLNNQPIYGRNKSFIVQAFDDNFIENVNTFNKDPYGSNQFSTDVSKSTLLTDPIFKLRYQENGGWILEVYYIPQDGATITSWIGENYSFGPVNKQTMSNFTKKSIVYLSICDCEWIDVEGSKSWTMGCCARDVI